MVTVARDPTPLSRDRRCRVRRGFLYVGVTESGHECLPILSGRVSDPEAMPRRQGVPLPSDVRRSSLPAAELLSGRSAGDFRAMRRECAPGPAKIGFLWLQQPLVMDCRTSVTMPPMGEACIRWPIQQLRWDKRDISPTVEVTQRVPLRHALVALEGQGETGPPLYPYAPCSLTPQLPGLTRLENLE